MIFAILTVIILLLATLRMMWRELYSKWEYDMQMQATKAPRLRVPFYGPKGPTLEDIVRMSSCTMCHSDDLFVNKEGDACCPNCGVKWEIV